MVSGSTEILETKNCILKNAMYISDLSANLISVSVISENGRKVIFTKNKVIVKKNKKEVLCGKKKNRQYEVRLSSEVMEKSYAVQNL